MNFSEKIYLLRKKYGYSQDELAEHCNVSRQSVSKWEAGVAFPDTERIIFLSNILKCSIDVLLKDENEIDSVTVMHKCGKNAINNSKFKLYEGILIKESLENDSLIDHISVNKIELWNAGGKPKYWTAIFFTSDERYLSELLSHSLYDDNNGNWFVDFKSGNTKYIVFRNKILKYTIGNQNEKAVVCEECRKLGVSDNEMHWSE